MLADILIVEDEKNISNLIEMALSRHGHKTDCVFNGESCADVLEKKHFDLILLDVMLPKISGFELMDYIKGFDTPSMRYCEDTTRQKQNSALKT